MSPQKLLFQVTTLAAFFALFALVEVCRKVELRASLPDMNCFSVRNTLKLSAVVVWTTERGETLPHPRLKATLALTPAS